jgi:O-antigen ligase
MMAHDAVKSPIFGHGAASAENVETNIRIDAGRIIPVTKPAGGRISHPHSFYLQTWYELGAIGAALLFLTGASVIQAIWKQSTDRERFSAMQFATIAVMIAPSYGIWSFWFESGISLSIWACAMANYGRPDAPPALEPANGGSTA